MYKLFVRTLDCARGTHWEEHELKKKKETLEEQKKLRKTGIRWRRKAEKGYDDLEEYEKINMIEVEQENGKRRSAWDGEVLHENEDTTAAIGGELGNIENMETALKDKHDNVKSGRK